MRTTKLSVNLGRDWLPIEEVSEDGEGEKDIKESINEDSKQNKQREESKKIKKSEENVNNINLMGNLQNQQKQEVQRLNCLATSISAADCSWSWPRQFEPKNNQLIGFRTVLSSTLFRKFLSYCGIIETDS